jgi:endonuclease/exonuclease/phosphatase family metal-dependent hydrolase
MQTRRDFLKTALAAGCAQLVMPSLSFAAATSQGLRTITYNILKGHGFSETAEGKRALQAAAPQIPQRLALELALYQPDVVSFQEAPPEKVVAAIAKELQMNHAFFAGGWNGAVLSRFEIIDPRNCPLTSWGQRPPDLFTRHWGRATLRAHGRDIAFFSAHLHPSDAAVRKREVSEVLKVMAGNLEKGEPVLFQGDLNHPPTGPEYPRWTGAGLVDLFSKLQEPGSPKNSFSSYQPAKRIDYIWVSEPLARRAKECRILYERAFRPNPDDPRSFALSDHLPVMAGFEP